MPILNDSPTLAPSGEQRVIEELDLVLALMEIASGSHIITFLFQTHLEAAGRRIS